MRFLTGFSLLVLALPLAGCETLGLTSPSPEEQFARQIGPICPATAVLSDAVTVTKLKPGTQTAALNPANVLFSAEMSQAKLNCSYNRNANRLTVDINFAVKATRGPAAQGADPQLDFFVAVVDVDNNVISKSVFHGELDMRCRNSNVDTQSVEDFAVPLAMDKQPYDYEILTGFQL